MSVFPAEAESPGPVAPERPRLRLVAPHEHDWRLRAVEYDDTFEVRRYECDGCDDVLYR